MAGCGTKQTQEKPTAVPKVGVINMDNAIKAHPKYKQLMVLVQQADGMAAGLEAQQLADAHQVQQLQNNAFVPTVSQNELDELNRAAAQEDQTKMAAKERELNEKLRNKAKEIEQKLTEEINAYGDQLDKEYQPQIFNLQLKLNVVQLSKEETAAIQAELDKIQAKRLEALNAKQAELSKRMNELMAPESAKLGQELENYQKTVDDERAQKIAAKQIEFFNRDNEQQKPVAAMESVTSKIPEQLAMKQQEIDALQGFIINDIIGKTAKVAAEGSFEAVLTHVAVNISAVDITTQVITECNK